MLTVLLVEDDFFNRDMLSRRLQRHDFKVLCATTAQEGIQTVLSSRPDVVLMDVSLPGLSGSDAARILKRSASTSQIPIIMLTAHGSDVAMQIAQGTGCDDFDTKPVDLARLVSKIRALTTAAPTGEHDT